MPPFAAGTGRRQGHPVRPPATSIVVSDLPRHVEGTLWDSGALRFLAARLRRPLTCRVVTTPMPP